MTNFPHDQFAKNYLNELLKPLGNVERGKSVAAEIRQIDVYFTPSQNQSPENIKKIGLLGKFASHSGLFEAFRNAATIDEIRSCTTKLHSTFAELQRNAKTNKKRIKEEELPFLWILTPTASKSTLNGFRAYEAPDEWSQGVYLLGNFWRGAIVVLHKLPSTKDTLWLRLLGRGKFRQRAVKELEILTTDNDLRSKAIELLLSLKTTLELKQDTSKIDQDDRGLIMQLSPIYLQRLAEAEQRGEQRARDEAAQLYQQRLAEAEQRGEQRARDEAAQLYQQRLAEAEQKGEQRARDEARQELLKERQKTVENILQARFGVLDEDLRKIIKYLLILSPEEFTPLLLQLSRQELLDRFNQS
ncbi:MAG: hypothetical protein IGS39_00895 [Calothrix sp. C42_A2020_038]|nr:hypothetical protein [Calothrix sp. C42_A2020_038]